MGLGRPRHDSIGMCIAPYPTQPMTGFVVLDAKPTPWELWVGLDLLVVDFFFPKEYEKLFEKDRIETHNPYGSVSTPRTTCANEVLCEKYCHLICKDKQGRSGIDKTKKRHKPNLGWIVENCSEATHHQTFP